MLAPVLRTLPKDFETSKTDERREPMKCINAKVIRAKQTAEVGDLACSIACGAMCLLLGSVGAAMGMIAESV